MDAGAVVADVVADHRFREPRIPFGAARDEPVDVRAGDVPAGEGGVAGPGRPVEAQRPGQQVHGLLGEPAAGGDLAAVHREHGRGAPVEMEHVVAGDLARVPCPVVEQGADAGVRPDDVAGGNGVLEVRVGRGAEVVHLPRRDRDRPRPALDLHLGGSEQGVLLLEGDREQYPAVPALEDVGMRVLEQLPDDDVAALHEPHVVLRVGGARGRSSPVRRGGVLHEPHAVPRIRVCTCIRTPAGGQTEGLGHPWPARIDHAPCRDGEAPARGPVRQRRLPVRAAARERDAFGAGAHVRAPQMRIAGVEHHQARVLHPAIRVLVPPAIVLLQRASARVPAQIDARARRQPLAPAEVVVEEQAQPDHPPGPQPGVVRQHETQGPDDVRGVAEQYFTLPKGVAHEPEIVVLQVTEPAVDQLGAGRGGMRGEVVLLAEQDVEAAPGRVPGDARAVDAAADDEQVDGLRPGIPHTHPDTAIPRATGRRPAGMPGAVHAAGRGPSGGRGPSEGPARPSRARGMQALTPIGTRRSRRRWRCRARPTPEGRRGRATRGG